MFKVICIDKPKNNCSIPGSPFPPIEVGSILTIMFTEKWRGEYFHIFEEIGEGFSYHADDFAPLNGPDEIEISEARCREEADALDIEFAEILENA